MSSPVAADGSCFLFFPSFHCFIVAVLVYLLSSISKLFLCHGSYGLDKNCINAGTKVREGVMTLKAGGPVFMFSPWVSGAEELCMLSFSLALHFKSHIATRSL